jgi:hypothetical protein
VVGINVPIPVPVVYDERRVVSKTAWRLRRAV